MYFNCYIRTTISPYTSMQKVYMSPLVWHAISTKVKRNSPKQTQAAQPDSDDLDAGSQKPSSLHEGSIGSEWVQEICQWAAALPVSVRHNKVVSSDWLSLDWVSGVRRTTPPTFQLTSHSGHSGRSGQRSPPQCSWQWVDQMNLSAGCRLLSGCLCTSSCPYS